MNDYPVLQYDTLNKFKYSDRYGYISHSADDVLCYRMSRKEVGDECKQRKLSL
jgi:hypothetical protein